MGNLVKVLILQAFLFNSPSADVASEANENHHFYQERREAPTKGPVYHPLRAKPYTRRSARV